MLHELHVRDFALIWDLSLELSPGFNVLTGETGAGKSIIIDALAFLLGARGQTEQLRSGASEAVVEGGFDVPAFDEFPPLMEAAGLSQDPDQFLLLRRHLSADGRSKAYINGSLVSLSTLRSLGDYLADIQGQHQSQSLLEAERQLELLDAYADHSEKVDRLRKTYQQVQGIRKELAEGARHRGDSAKRAELLQFQREEIEAAQLRPEEEEEISQERAILAHAEKLFAASELALAKISEDPASALDCITSAISSLKGCIDFDSRLSSALEPLESAKIYLEEAASFLSSYRGKIDFEPARLEELEVRLSTIAKMKRKYGGSVPEILSYLQEIREEMEEIRGWAEKEAQLLAQRQELLLKMGQLAGEVSRGRRKAARSMEREVQEELRQLGMPQAIFQVRISEPEDAEGELLVEGKRYPLSPRGIEQVEFLFSANPGEPVKPLSKIASGGELSRALLALKTVLAALDEIPTLILDEVDVGISGSMAEVIGQKITTFGRQRQVLCITHLPQIAAFGDTHFRVEKEQEDDRTRVKVERLKEKERINEIARMLGDKGISRTPTAHATEILSLSRNWKRTPNAALGTSKRI
jgi:DNA repair protein RecN (Recombination protein N)